MGHAVDVTLVLGPMVFAVIFNAFLYGICVLQFCYYWETRTRDAAIIRLLVGWTLLLDTFHTSALFYMIWEYAVVHFNDPAFLSTVLWPFSSTPIVTTMTSFPIQIYLSWRIRQFSHSTRVFTGLVMLAFTQASLGVICSAAAFHVPRIGSYRSLIPFVDAWQVVAVATDVSITLLLSWYLLKSRTGQKSSDNVISRVIRSSVETAAFGAFFCIMDLITFTLLQDTNFHVIFAFPMGRIYTNTLLMTLNSRKSLRAELERPIVPDILLDQSINSASYHGTGTGTHSDTSGAAHVVGRRGGDGGAGARSTTTTTTVRSLKQSASELMLQQVQQQSSIVLNVTVYSTGSGGGAGAGAGVGSVQDTHISGAVQICHGAAKDV